MKATVTTYCMQYDTYGVDTVCIAPPLHVLFEYFSKHTMHIKVYYRRYAYPHQILAWCIFISAQVCDELLDSCVHCWRVWRVRCPLSNSKWKKDYVPP